MPTQGAMGNLINRYRAVLKKCTLINMFGSLAVASMLVMGGASCANAVELNDLIGDATFLYGHDKIITKSGKYVGGSQIFETGDSSPISTYLLLYAPQFQGELTAGSLASGTGASAAVNRADIYVMDDISLGSASGPPSAIRGGGIAANGGSSTVKLSTIYIGNATLTNTNVWAGGVAVDNASTAHTEASYIVDTDASDATVFEGQRLHAEQREVRYAEHRSVPCGRHGNQKH